MFQAAAIVTSWIYKQGYNWCWIFQSCLCLSWAWQGHWYLLHSANRMHCCLCLCKYWCSLWHEKRIQEISPNFLLKCRIIFIQCTRFDMWMQSEEKRELQLLDDIIQKQRHGDEIWYLSTAKTLFQKKTNNYFSIFCLNAQQLKRDETQKPPRTSMWGVRELVRFISISINTIYVPVGHKILSVRLHWKKFDNI